MKQFMSLPQQVNTNSTKSSRAPSSLPISNAEMQQLLKEGKNPAQNSNSERIKELERADFITDIGGLVVPEMNAANAAINGVKGAEQSPCETTMGRALDGTLDGAFNLLIGATSSSNLADIGLPEGWKISDLTDSTSSAMSSSLEYLATGDLTGMSNYSRKAQSGEYGKIVQEASQSGSFWGKEGIEGGMKIAKEEVVDLIKDR